MGSNISVVNETDQSLHICLKQISPLYFENYIKPRQTFSRDVGKVWFTIETRLAFDKNEYSSGQSILQGFIFSATAVASLLGPGLLMTGAAGAIGAIAASNSGGVVWSPGWYMGYDRRIEIRCKVASTLEEQNTDSGITEKRVGDGGILQFYLVEVCPSKCGRESKGRCAHCS